MSCILNATSNRSLAICRLLSQPLFAHPEIHLTVMGDKWEISLEHKTWGSLVMFGVSALPASQSFLITHFPEYPNTAETQLFRTALLLKLNPIQSDIRRLASSVSDEEQLLARLANELFQIRSEQRANAIKWFINGLRIWGIDMLDQPQRDNPQGGLLSQWSKRMGLIQKPRAAFDFIVQGSPAEFTVMARESILKEMGVICTVFNPGTQRKILEFPLDINPIAVRFLDRNTALDLVVHKLLNGNTLLKVSLSDTEKGWCLWNAFRDEMERLGWFSIPAIENVSLFVDFKTPEIKSSVLSSSNTDSEPLPLIDEPKKEPSQTWLMIPDKGWDRECIRLWHRGLTCKDIGIRLQKTDKTILNRLNQLRKEFGEQTVPYRNANYRSG
jgi:hypothetical protein